MALPRIDTPIFYLKLPLSGKEIKFRPFLVKEQKNLLMALEADDKQTIERNIKQILHNCTLTEDVDIDNLPVVDVEYYFINLRAKSVGEIVENNYICNSESDGVKCGNKMKVVIDLNTVQIDNYTPEDSLIKLTDNISIKLKYPEFSIVSRLSDTDNSIEAAFKVIVESIEYIFDGDQYYYANETDSRELMEFVESLNQEQFSKLEKFFDNLPKIKKDVEIKCSKCGYDHSITVEGLENFFG
jgi:T4 bacteriophage base plate protein